MKRHNVLYFFLFLLTIFWGTGWAINQDKIFSLPGFGAVSDSEYAGYLPVFSAKNTTSSGSLFYWYVAKKERADDVPLVLWLNGGPGAASTYGFFMENGPYELENDLTVRQRPYSWTQKADYLIIDQPAGTGLSYGTPTTYADEPEAMDQLYQALNLFFTRYPHLKNKKLYLAGESYAGKYLPQLAIRIIAHNATQKEKIRLEGLLIGDAWVNPKVQQEANADFAYYHGLVDEQGKQQVEQLYKECAKEIDKATPSSRQANRVCMKIQDFIQQQSGNLNLANIAKGKEPEDKLLIRYLNDPRVRKALHVDPRIIQYNTFSTMVADLLETGEQDSVADLYPSLLAAGVKILLYNGLEDGKDSNFLGTKRWLSQLNWPYQAEFNKARSCTWYVKSEVAGYAKSSRNLTHVLIRNAGHLAPIDQPEALLDLLGHFIEEKPLC